MNQLYNISCKRCLSTFIIATPEAEKVAFLEDISQRSGLHRSRESRGRVAMVLFLPLSIMISRELLLITFLEHTDSMYFGVI